MSQLFKTGIVVGTGNSTNVPLGANQTFVGSTDDVTSFEEVDINVAGSPSNAPGSLYFEFSPDQVHWDVSILVGNAQYYGPNIIPQHLRVVLPYFRVRYVNGNIPQTEFRLTTIYHRVSGTRLTRYLHQTIDSTEGVEMTRSIIDGYRPDGTYGNILVSSDNHLIVDGYIQNFPVSQAITQSTIPWLVQDNIGDGYLQSILANQTNGTQQVVIDGYVQTNPNVNVANIPTVNQGTNPWTTDVTDRAARLLGHVSVDGYVQTNPNVNVSGTVTANAGTGNFDVAQSSNIDAGNSSTTPLAGNASFTGTGIDVSNYGVITTFIYTDQPGTLYMQSSIDNVHWDDSRAYVIDGYDAEHIQSGPQARYFRVVYTNGTSAQSIFRLQTIERPIIAFNPVDAVLNAVDGADDAILTKSVISARTSNIQGANDYVDIQASPTGALGTYIADSSNITAFGSLRVATPLALFSSKQIYNNQPLYWDDQQISGSGTSSTYLTNQAATKMTVTNNAAGTRVRQTFRRLSYQPAKSQLMMYTGLLVAEGGTGNAAVNRRLGSFDGYNGYFFELTGTTMNVALRTNTSGTPATTYIAQSNWNIDKMDGTGPSGIVLDLSKVQIFVIDFQWLGTGRIRYGFDVNGIILYCHQILIANLQTNVSISIPNLPVRFEIQSLGTGTSSTSYMNHICGAVISEGGQEDVGFSFGVDTGTSGFTTGNNTSTYTLLAVQIQNTMLSADIVPTFFTVSSITPNTQFTVSLILNPTIAGGALSYTPVTNSALQYAIGSVGNTISGGTVIYSGVFQTNKTGSATDRLTIDISLGSNIAGVSDTLVLAVRPTPALAIALTGSFNWKEQQ